MAVMFTPSIVSASSASGSTLSTSASVNPSNNVMSSCFSHSVCTTAVSVAALLFVFILIIAVALIIFSVTFIRRRRNTKRHSLKPDPNLNLDSNNPGN